MRFRYKLSKSSVVFAVLTVLFSLAPLSLNAQGTDLDAMRTEAFALIDTDKYLEALPLLEKLAVAEPNNSKVQFFLGVALLADATSNRDKTTIQQKRIRARNAFIKAKQIGTDIEIVDAMIASIPEDGSLPAKYSKDPAAEELMLLGETAFSGGKYDEALTHYQKALKLDATIYEAALYSGDMYFRKDDYVNAEYWYQQAIKMNPFRETAYRYSASPLMVQEKYDEARDRYIEAFITEPYNQFTPTGITQWANATDARLGHTRIDIPVEMKESAKAGYDTVLDASVLLDSKKGDGSAGWLVYGATRNEWRKEKFAKTFPNEKTYRHSLNEEAAALRDVISAAVKTKDKNTDLTKTIAFLKKLNDDGMLEAYILLAIPDQDIAQDHPAYLRSNRDKLRRYFVEYVIQKD